MCDIWRKFPAAWNNWRGWLCVVSIQLKMHWLSICWCGIHVSWTHLIMQLPEFQWMIMTLLHLNRHERRRHRRIVKIRKEAAASAPFDTEKRQISAGSIENGNGSRQQSRQSHLLLYQLQNLRQCRQIQIGLDAQANGDDRAWCNKPSEFHLFSLYEDIHWFRG